MAGTGQTKADPDKEEMVSGSGTSAGQRDSQMSPGLWEDAAFQECAAGNGVQSVEYCRTACSGSVYI